MSNWLEELERIASVPHWECYPEHAQDVAEVLPALLKLARAVEQEKAAYDTYNRLYEEPGGVGNDIELVRANMQWGDARFAVNIALHELTRQPAEASE